MSQPKYSLQGWQKLPDELKLEIIRLALPADLQFGAVDFDDGKESEQWDPMPAMPNGLELSPEDCGKKNVRGSKDMFDTQVLPLFACPTISYVAIEAFYTQNTMRFRVEKDLSIRLPPRPVREYVRSLAGEVSHRPGELAALERVAHDDAGFSKLQVVILTIANKDDKPKEWDAFHEALKAIDPILFKAKKLIFTYWLALEYNPRDNVEDLACARFGGLRGEGHTTELCERFRVPYHRDFYEDDGSRAATKIAGRWSEDTWLPYIRATVKTVWLS
ncbi:hypothetical protein DE146DRAFT_757839 [Phaeosphaeria sp. MPI-PUGE-AT-0046c]|nr:hypothetical protein DE146DRAFT_757839 [Phaeosphaeria sp. MPI-PUGE-AT-0046c]